MSRRSVFLLAATVVMLYFSIILFMLSPLHGVKSAYYGHNYYFNHFTYRQIPQVHWCRELKWKSPPSANVTALVSYPGSGNTWLRYLLQQVTVTGASAGIGKSIALYFAQYGAKLAIVGRNLKELNKVAEECAKKRGNTPLTIIADLSTDVGCEKTAKNTIEHYKRLDILVNNAGGTARTILQTTDMEVFDRVFNLNVRGVYNLTRLVVPELIKTKGNIVNISSISGSKVALGSLPYGMTKAALDHFTRLIALELAPLGVRVNSVSPGLTESKIVQRITNITDEQYKGWLSEAASSIPMGEVCTGEDIAKMVLHLASDNSRLVTGTTVAVDGCLLYGRIVTGSIYMDYGLRVHGFPAENVTDGSVLVVKTHEAPPLELVKFKSAILLIRDPRDAILADFNRLHKGHIGTAPKYAFKRRSHEHKKSDWATYVTNQLTVWESLHKLWLTRFHGPVHIVFYEILVRDTRDTLKKMLDFLNHTVTEEDMNCALVNREGIYRRKKKLENFDPFTPLMYQELSKVRQRVLGVVMDYQKKYNSTIT